MNRIRYRDIKLKNIDGFLVARAASEETGLPYDILLDSLGKNNTIPSCPRVGVIVGDNVILVQISDDPVVLSGDDFPDANIVLNWVARYKTELLRHWNKEITDLEILEAAAFKRV
jgi:hypothetical protein